MRWIRHLAWLSMIFVVACSGAKSDGTSWTVPTETPPPLATPVYSRTTSEPTPDSSPIPRATVGPGGVQDASNRIFVDLTGGDDAGDGTRKNPLQTLGAALDRAAAIESPEVFVSGGLISGTVNLSSPVQIFGGFDASTWGRQDGQSTTITSTGYALVITGDGVLVDGFTLRTTGRVGVNSIAVLAQSASDVVLTNDIIITANGAGGSAGSDGGTGTPGSNGEAGEDAGDCPATKPGGAGGPGSISAGGKGGDGTPKSGIAGEPGSNGGGSGGARGSSLQDGKPGENGTKGISDLDPGGGGRPFGILASSGYAPSAGEDGDGSTGDGKAGGGGGGGGGGGRSTSPCGAGGGGGGGGGIGSKAHGKGGQGGGASVGVLALNAEISVVRSEVVTGDGGAGGRGGDGGKGGPGGKGGSGGARDVTAAAGGYGGDGGSGGDSAPGGGGGGGPSIGVLGDSSSKLNVSSTRFTLGAGGTGGAGGASASINGEPADEGSDGRVDDVYRAPEPDQ